MDQEFYDRYRRAKELAPRLVYSPTEHWNTTGFKGKDLKAYEVSLDGVTIGRVLQQVHHTYKTKNRVRYGDRYTLRWQYDFPKKDGGHRLYEETRERAAIELLADLLKLGKIK